MSSTPPPSAPPSAPPSPAPPSQAPPSPAPASPAQSSAESQAVYILLTMAQAEQGPPTSVLPETDQPVELAQIEAIQPIQYTMPNAEQVPPDPVLPATAQPMGLDLITPVHIMPNMATPAPGPLVLMDTNNVQVEKRTVNKKKREKKRPVPYHGPTTRSMSRRFRGFTASLPPGGIHGENAEIPNDILSAPNPEIIGTQTNGTLNDVGSSGQRADISYQNAVNGEGQVQPTGTQDITEAKSVETESTIEVPKENLELGENEGAES
ncbi:putative uncharacterized protein DDB_G0290521 isoform X2 [Drosophila obscura]|uniref:putative uncharacterized protein DDB_G0290521 isoform X2 n=1 Tax=Drosophila obscura TaxID=7282 RepID=UPI001BB1CF72|nr:putative uncharacterized protein DDB_G0290521 isoform X2 [Drosophila obscura]